MRYYIAYGSNLNKWQMSRRCTNATAVGIGLLKDYQLAFKGSKTGAYLTIERAKGQTVPVGVWFVNPVDEKRLDMYEGYPDFYTKEEITIDMLCLNERGVPNGTYKTIEAFVYIMNKDAKIKEPDDWYIDVCVEGYECFGFDTMYLNNALGRARS